MKCILLEVSESCFNVFSCFFKFVLSNWKVDFVFAKWETFKLFKPSLIRSASYWRDLSVINMINSFYREAFFTWKHLIIRSAGKSGLSNAELRQKIIFEFEQQGNQGLAFLFTENKNKGVFVFLSRWIAHCLFYSKWQRKGNALGKLHVFKCENWSKH